MLKKKMTLQVADALFMDKYEVLYFRKLAFNWEEVESIVVGSNRYPNGFSYDDFTSIVMKSGDEIVALLTFEYCLNMLKMVEFNKMNFLCLN